MYRKRITTTESNLSPSIKYSANCGLRIAHIIFMITAVEWKISFLDNCSMISSPILRWKTLRHVFIRNSMLFVPIVFVLFFHCFCDVSLDVGASLKIRNLYASCLYCKITSKLIWRDLFFHRWNADFVKLDRVEMAELQTWFTYYKNINGKFIFNLIGEQPTHWLSSIAGI